MQIASILSDLTSLRVCDHSAALALVSAHETSDGAKNDKLEQADADMQRVTDILDLHENLKMKHEHTQDKALVQAREEVNKVLRRLETASKAAK